jgi:hypothetical protein
MEKVTEIILVIMYYTAIGYILYKYISGKSQTKEIL